MYSKDDSESGRSGVLSRNKGKSGGERINFHGFIRSIDSFRFVFVTVSAFIDLRKSMKKEKERIKTTMTNQIIVID
jgi:hypothetical protein